jgi:hypothetical protein
MSANQPRRRVLSDHTREGKIFKTPFTKLGPFEETSWLRTTMPEMLWIGLLLSANSLRTGVEFCLSCSKSARKSVGDDSPLWFAAMSSFDALNVKQKSANEERP